MPKNEEELCPKCKGDQSFLVKHHSNQGYILEKCPDCNGTGKKK